MILKIFFLSFSNAHVKFARLIKLTWRSYDTTEALLIINRGEIIHVKKFVIVVEDKNSEILMMYITTRDTNCDTNISL